MSHTQDPARWARLRFAIIGPLLAAPPKHGQLRKQLLGLSRQAWRHPAKGTDVYFSVATIERWYYAARKAQDPVQVLGRSRRNDAGRTRGLNPALVQAIQTQYQNHTGWTVQLHYDNLVALAREEPVLAPVPSYSTIRRYMKAQGYHRKRMPKRDTAGARLALERLEKREVRSYEAEHVNSLWHADFHHGSHQVLLPSGRWVTPLLLGIIDDHSRLICHLQWYLDETAQTLVHGLSQALQKRALPRVFMTDNGAAMQAEEFTSGLLNLSIGHDTTLPYSPYQNAKMEVFWANVEGRLMAMLENVENLSLDQLNDITQVWVEQEYNQKWHSEIQTTPIARYLNAPDVGRDCPSSIALQQAFRCLATRKQRRSDGTVSLLGKRLEVPSAYRHLESLTIAYARWNLRSVDLLDAHTQKVLCALYPLDKSANANAQRRALAPQEEQHTNTGQPDTELPPLLRKLMAEFAETGLPPAYLPKPSETKS